MHSDTFNRRRAGLGPVLFGVLAAATEAYSVGLQGTALVTTGYGRDAASESLDWVSLRLTAAGALGLVDGRARRFVGGGHSGRGYRKPAPRPRQKGSGGGPGRGARDLQRSRRDCRGRRARARENTGGMWHATSGAEAKP